MARGGGSTERSAHFTRHRAREQWQQKNASIHQSVPPTALERGADMEGARNQHFGAARTRAPRAGLRGRQLGDLLRLESGSRRQQRTVREADHQQHVNLERILPGFDPASDGGGVFLVMNECLLTSGREGLAAGQSKAGEPVVGDHSGPARDIDPLLEGRLGAGASWATVPLESSRSGIRSRNMGSFKTEFQQEQCPAWYMPRGRHIYPSLCCRLPRAVRSAPYRSYRQLHEASPRTASNPSRPSRRPCQPSNLCVRPLSAPPGHTGRIDPDAKR